jgi:hypothetical protein
MRRTPAVLGMMLALLLAACSGGGSAPSEAAVGSASSPADDERAGDPRPKQERKDEEPGKGEKGGSRASTAGGTRDRSSSGGSERGKREGSSPRGSSALSLPQAGSYSYVQTGWEELCQAARCDRSDLPPNQTVDIAYRTRSAERGIFTSETRNAGSRTQTLTYDVRDDRAFITALESTFSTGSFRFRSEIVPQPPVVAAVFPLRVGKSWSGRWEDRNGNVDGSYRFEVVGRDRASVDGRTEDVVAIDVKPDLSGDFEGVNEMRMWIVPRDLTIAATKGFVDIDSQYGTYRSRFTTSYRSGPSGGN